MLFKGKFTSINNRKECNVYRIILANDVMTALLLLFFLEERHVVYFRRVHKYRVGIYMDIKIFLKVKEHFNNEIVYVRIC